MPRKKQYEIDAVIDKAMLTFWHNGYKSTSVRMLEKEMGINQFSIYSSFGNKHDLFIEVLKKYKNYVKSTFLKELLNSEGSVDDIRRFLYDFGHSIRTGKNSCGCLMVNTGAEIDEKDVMIMHEVKLYFDFIKSTFVNTLEKTKLKGELTKDFEINKSANFLLGSLQGLSVYAKFQNEEEINDFIDSIMKTIS